MLFESLGKPGGAFWADGAATLFNIAQVRALNAKTSGKLRQTLAITLSDTRKRSDA